MKRVVYLHGFASGPGSKKARYFSERLAECGVSLEVPDLAEGDFENLTVTGPVEGYGARLRQRTRFSDRF